LVSLHDALPIYQAAPLAGGSHADVTGYSVANGKLVARTVGGETGLKDPSGFAGYRGDAGDPSAVLLRNNHLHVEIVIDRRHDIGATDRAGVADVLLESAITTIMRSEERRVGKEWRSSLRAD